MKKISFFWLCLIWILTWCSSPQPISSDLIDYDELKTEIKEEVLIEIKEDLMKQVWKEVDKIENVVGEIEDSVDQVEADIQEVEEEVANVEDTVDDLDSDQNDLENLFDISKVEITAEGNQAKWSFDIAWWIAVWKDYINDDIVTPWREYSVIIRQLDSWWYMIVHDDFDVTLTQQQCSTSDWWEVFAYYASIKDDSWNELEWCANVKL